MQERAEALKTLAQFRVKGAVDAITRVARHEPEPNLRAIAISSLGAIDHESVFPAILIGMADESREVRAGSARALNRLSFDRADAYVRVIETERRRDRLQRGESLHSVRHRFAKPRPPSEQRSPPGLRNVCAHLLVGQSKHERSGF